MHSFFSKTFGGLTPSYYVRQLIFGSLFPILIMSVMASSSSGLAGKPGLIVMCVVCTLLYPYSRFVYESVMGYVMGNNVFFVNAPLMLFVKSLTMMLCWWLSVFMAPVGLAYLYWRNSRQISQ